MQGLTIKRVMFGGFDKQDVVRYIEQTAEKTAAEQKELQEENAHLLERTEELDRKCAELSEQLEKLAAQRDSLQEALNHERALREKLEPLQEEASQLRAQNEALRPDAESYVQLRENLGAIECEARKRASEMERVTVTRLMEIASQFRGQYQALMSVVETTSGHVTGELRKMEVTLAQLPRAMDRSAAELKKLEELMEKKDPREE